MVTNEDLSIQIARLQEQVKGIERRVGRIEIGILAVLVAAAAITVQQVLSASGVAP